MRLFADLVRSLVVLGLTLSLAIAQDFRLENVRVVTGTGIDPIGTVLDVRDGRIVDPADIDPSETVPVHRMPDGACVVPGLVDAHAHLLGLGESKVAIDLVGTTSYEEVIRAAVERASTLPEGTWILGRGWDQNDWSDTGFPTHQALSRALPNHPVLFTRVDGHAALANLAAMRLAQIDRDTVDPSGGDLLRDDAGELTGVLIDNAQSLVRAVVPRATDTQVREALLAAQSACFELGLTSVHDAGLGGRTLSVMKKLHAEGLWHLRVYAMLPAGNVEEIRLGPWATSDGLLTVRAVKAYADGALGSRGAALLEPYTDAPGNRGLLLTPRAGLVRTAELCLENDFQLCVHAIGDRANRLVLDVFEEVVPASKRSLVRFRIEHAQIIHPDDFVRFRELAVLPSMQPTHLSSDMPWAPERLGEDRIRGAYAWTRFHALGLPTPFGSDFPVERPDPLLGLFAAITARAPGDTADGDPASGTAASGKAAPADGYLPEQRLSRLRALQGFTRDAAFAAFAEGERGTIQPGMLADLTVFDRDLMTCPIGALPEAEVLMTVVGGRIVQRSSAGARALDEGALDALTRQVDGLLSVLASDRMAGRNTPSPQLEMAADWIAEQFQEAGLSEGPTGRFHTYELPGLELPTASAVCGILGEDRGVRQLVPETEFRLWSGGRPFSVEEAVVPLGSGAGEVDRRRELAGRSLSVVPVETDSPVWAAAAGNRKVISRRAAGASPSLLIDAALIPEGASELRLKLEIPAPEQVQVPLRNVVGMIEGSDLKNEFVVVSAHYDHIGVDPRGGEDTIYNGADDDATGTVAVISIAKALADAGFQPRRSILFVAFSAEEKGLLGSTKFVENPPVPLDSIACVVNIEMLGRPERETEPFCWVTGNDMSDFESIIQPILRRAGVEVQEFEMAGQLFFASDNAPFARAGVVAHSVSAGTLHKDYHQPNDEADRIDSRHMAAVVHGLTEVVRDLASRDARPSWSPDAQDRLRPRRRR